MDIETILAFRLIAILIVCLCVILLVVGVVDAITYAGVCNDQ